MPPDSESPKRWLTRQLPLLLILLLATGLRFYRLGAQSFWNDEGNTARLVERRIPLILEGAAGDIHPPGYYLLLHLWRAVAGASEFALRAYSALVGVLTVAVTARVARQIERRKSGSGTWSSFAHVLVAAVLAAVHPLAIYYSQEARMYAQLALVSALTLWCASALVRRAPAVGSASVFARSGNTSAGGGPESRGDKGGAVRISKVVLPTLALALCVAAGLYTQYLYVLGLLGLNVVFGLHWLLRRTGDSAIHTRRTLLLRWIAAHVLGGLLFLPWAPIALRATGWRPPDLDAGRALEAMVTALLAGVTLPGRTPWWLFAVAGALMLLAVVVLVSGLREGASRGPHFAGWGALGMTVAPPILILVAGIYRPAYLKFLMVSVPPLALVLALPVRSLSLRGRWQGLFRVMALLLLLPLLRVQVRALDHLYHDPVFERDDYRGIAARIRAEGRPGDAILLNAPNQWEVFTYYYRGSLPVYAAPYRPTEAEAETWVQTILAQHSPGAQDLTGGRLFVLYWGDTESDPGRLIERTLAALAFKAQDTWITSVRLALYGTGEPVTEAGAATDAVFGDGSIRLTGYHLPDTDFTPGDVVPLTLFWRAEQALDARFKVFVHLVDAKGELVTQVDTEPRDGFALTTTWDPGEAVVDRYGLALPDDLPPGTYTVLAGLYHLTGERLRVTSAGDGVDSDAVRVDAITVTPVP
ncbi:MAG: hypothetical protein ACP5JG_14935 [Anaerolineae bacterium]